MRTLDDDQRRRLAYTFSQWREARTLAEASREVGIGEKTLGEIENAQKTTMRNPTINKLARVIPAWEILGFTAGARDFEDSADDDETPSQS